MTVIPRPEPNWHIGRNDKRQGLALENVRNPIGAFDFPAMSCTYLLPIRRSAFDRAETDRILAYLSSIRSMVAEIIVADGSPDDVFAEHRQVWSSVCRHERVDRQFGCLNDKVNGIQTGVRLATTDRVVLADDDIRYSPNRIAEISALLDQFDVVRPQNYFAGEASHATAYSLPAKMEAARMLVNRALLRTADYPGTCAFRRNVFLDAGAYDGDVLFDNEELIRHLARSGARILYANDFFVAKRSPTFRKWLEQRPRQAYEDFGLRAKTALFAVLPVFVLGVAMTAGIGSTLSLLLGLTVLTSVVAFAGWRRGSAKDFFPLHVCLFAPLWAFERSLSTYWAFYWYFRRGGYPFGGRLLQKGIGRDWVEGGKLASRAVVALRSQNEQGAIEATGFGGRPGRAIPSPASAAQRLGR